MRNERAIIMGLAYIAGFTAAFIAYGTPYAAPQYASPETVKAEGGEVGTNSATIHNAYLNGEGLFAEVGDQEMIISAKAEASTTSMDGFHYAIPLVEVSPNAKYIHYCEQTVEIPTECKHFVYVAKDHTVWRVEYNDEQVVSEVGALEAGWTEDGMLYVGELASVSETEPWLVE